MEKVSGTGTLFPYTHTLVIFQSLDLLIITFLSVMLLTPKFNTKCCIVNWKESNHILPLHLFQMSSALMTRCNEQGESLSISVACSPPPPPFIFSMEGLMCNQSLTIPIYCNYPLLWGKMSKVLGQNSTWINVSINHRYVFWRKIGFGAFSICWLFMYFLNGGLITDLALQWQLKSQMMCSCMQVLK